MNLKSILLAFGLGALTAGGVTWLVLRGSDTTTSQELAHTPSSANPDGAPVAVEPPADGPAPAANDPTLRGASGATDHLTDLEQKNEALEAELAQLLEKVERLQPKPRDPRAFRFGLPEKAASFDQAEWKDLSSHMKELTGILDELKDEVVGGKQPGPKMISRIVKHNTPLAEFAVQVSAELDDEHAANANEAYTHPAVIANLIRASLAAAELPLSEDQEIAIQALGDAWGGEQERTAASIPVGAPLLKHTVLEVDAKLRFLASVKSRLTQPQRDALFNPETEGRLKLDLLSPALVYVLSFPVESKDRADMETKLLKQILEHAGIEREDVSEFAWIAREWVDAIPGVTDAQLPRSVDLIFPHVDQVQMRARAQVQAAERLLAMGGLTEEQAAQLRAVNTLLYPYVVFGAAN